MPARYSTFSIHSLVPSCVAVVESLLKGLWHIWVVLSRLVHPPLTSRLAGIQRGQVVFKSRTTRGFVIGPELVGGHRDFQMVTHDINLIHRSNRVSHISEPFLYCAHCPWLGFEVHNPKRNFAAKTADKTEVS